LIFVFFFLAAALLPLRGVSDFVYIRGMDTSALTPFQKLDIVLDYINNISEPHFRTFTEIQAELKEKEIVFGKHSKELSLILQKLEDDKLVTLELHDPPEKAVRIGYTKPNKIKRYYPCFNGQLFMDSGGYVKDQERRNRERIRLDDIQKKQVSLSEGMNRLTLILVIVGIPAFFYAILQIIDWYIKYHGCHCH
jgi:hypothetical protein